MWCLLSPSSGDFQAYQLHWVTLCQSAVIFFQRPFPLSAFALKFLFHSLHEPLTVFVVLSVSLATFLYFNCEPHETHSARKGIAVFPSANTPFSHFCCISCSSRPHPAYTILCSLFSVPYRNSYLLALCIKGKYHIVWLCPTARQDDHVSFPEWNHKFTVPGPLKQAMLFPSRSERNKEWCWQRKVCDLVIK